MYAHCILSSIDFLYNLWVTNMLAKNNNKPKLTTDYYHFIWSIPDEYIKRRSDIILKFILPVTSLGGTKFQISALTHQLRNISIQCIIVSAIILLPSGHYDLDKETHQSLYQTTRCLLRAIIEGSLLLRPSVTGRISFGKTQSAETMWKT